MRDILGMTDYKSESRKNTTRAGSNPAPSTMKNIYHAILYKT